MTYRPEKLLTEVSELLQKAEVPLTFDINCYKMPKHEVFHDKLILRKEGFFGKLFSELDLIIEKPVIYWFEAEDREAAEKYLVALNKYRNSKERLETYTNKKGDTRQVNRVIPAENKNCEKFPDSKVLYVGKSEAGYTEIHKLSDISGRMIVHLGYYGVPTTQGLQLYHWARKIESPLTLNIIQLPKSIANSKNETKEYLSVLEKLYAIQLRPLCGKH